MGLLKLNMIKNCFNYVGSKDRIFPLIDENLDKSKKIFIDLFCGSGVVGVNEVHNYDKVVLNDACWQVMDTLKFFRDNKFTTVISEIQKVMDKYELSKTNQEGYLALREYYNSDPYLRLVFEPAVFYCLVAHSFNYNIHINSSGKFSVPFGKDRSCFNISLRKKLQAFQEELYANKDKVTIKSEDFMTLMDGAKKFWKNSMIYVDPPYLSSDSSYGRIHYLGKWDGLKEKALYDILDRVDEYGGSFLLSNVVENNGNVNKILQEWSSKYNVIDVPVDYTNCNYQRKNAGETREVLVRNY